MKAPLLSDDEGQNEIVNPRATAGNNTPSWVTSEEIPSLAKSSNIHPPSKEQQPSEWWATEENNTYFNPDDVEEDYGLPHADGSSIVAAAAAGWKCWRSCCSRHGSIVRTLCNWCYYSCCSRNKICAGEGTVEDNVGSMTDAFVAHEAMSKVDTKPAAPFMDMAVDEAVEGVFKGEGGPFGAVIVGPDGKVIARAHNMVLQQNDPTAHAEVTCIRKACARLGTFDLSDCVIYSSCEPCPMCYGAIHWAKLPTCKYAATAADAAKAGFDDQFIYDAIRNQAKEVHCKFTHEPHEGACTVFDADYGLY